MNRLPPVVWRPLFLVPYALAFIESFKPFIEQSWEFPRDALSDFFACIVMGVGFCVSLYAGSYFSKEDARKFYPLLFFFTGSMLGVLWADHVFALFTFWEATSLCSFLLIAFKYQDLDVRMKARQALIVNTAGGLSLLTALLIMADRVGSYSLSVILQQADLFSVDNTFLILLVAFAAMTKSAQFPLHFWLPNAMKAPTPASCYLHSATMVKLGVFLLARFSPLFEGETLWVTTLCVVGAITLIWGLFVSLVKTDLKLLFAWTTVSSLGALFILIGLPFSYSWKSFFSYLFAHSCYKASLFLCVGNIDKQIGTRDIYSITDLIRRMPITSAAIVLSLGSMIGLPFSLGFLGKEYLLQSALLLKGPGSLLIAVLVCSSALSIVVAYRLLKLMFKRDRRPGKVLREAPVAMWLPALFLSLVGWVVSFFLGPLNEYVLIPVVSSILLQEMDLKLQMWTGFNAGIGLSIISAALGVLLSWAVARHLTRVEMWLRFDRSVKNRIDLVYKFASRLTSSLQNGRLSVYMLWLLLPVFAVSFYFLFQLQIDSWRWTGSWIEIFPMLMIFCGLVPLVKSSSNFTQVMGLGIVGYAVGLIFLNAAATDLAMTQIAVETVALLVFILVLDLLRQQPLVLSRGYQWGRGLVSVISFFAVLGIGSLIHNGKVPSQITPFFMEKAPTVGRGENVVNVILVDFRALDTMGEITVLGIVALGAYFLFLNQKKVPMRLRESIIIKKAMAIFLPLFVLVSLYVLYRGHNQPGGGFVGGLIFAIALAFYALIHGAKSAERILVIKPIYWIGAGIFLALLAGLYPLAYSNPYFTAQWWGEGGLGTPLIFDIGVFVTVVGVVSQLSFSLKGRRL
ncbi:NADH dehydrogenase [Bdellovibrio bacteriovorus]|uniref:NADH dehydrogenase n=1 Tax=Bdellovibrio bacteriovorus TaxID=959 RepID=A0A150WNP7_BDEBC|nr:hydrogen gas-evolving membrane-bound hydrogenase subunit E [Bdellovibrio bacteriovorus]KYG65944.1 NADH dehydrogenase [Bdellovibrio bacteriovorus]